MSAEVGTGSRSERCQTPAPSASTQASAGMIGKLVHNPFSTFSEPLTPSVIQSSGYVQILLSVLSSRPPCRRCGLAQRRNGPLGLSLGTEVLKILEMLLVLPCPSAEAVTLQRAQCLHQEAVAFRTTFLMRKSFLT